MKHLFKFQPSITRQNLLLLCTVKFRLAEFTKKKKIKHYCKDVPALL